MRSPRETLLLAAAMSLAAPMYVAGDDVVYDQPVRSTGGYYRSCWWEPDDSDWDQYVWDGFRLTSDEAITEIRWVGCFDPGYWGSGGPVVGFTVSLWSSIVGDSQPDIGSYFRPNPLAEHMFEGNAGQTYLGVYGGVTMYEYHLTLPTPFQATGGEKYWVEIVAWQHGVPDWALAAATGGDGGYFRYVRGAHQYQLVSGDAAFSLLAAGGLTYTISASASPANAGTISGAGVYPAGSTAMLAAMPNGGFGFYDWTENGAPLSTDPTYQFIVTADRTLVANFVPAYTITTGSAPTYAGTTSGGGTYNTGSNVVVSANANPGFLFVNWTEFGNEVSTLPDYGFIATANRSLVANFASDPLSATFDFENASLHTSLPIDLVAGGVVGHFSATGQGFSIQWADTMGFTPAGFAGKCVYPNSVFPADLLVSFSETLTGFSILYATQELGCHDSATMRVTAYLDGAWVGTNTTTAASPGTWPSETLRIVAPTGFNAVVVHYDARPPTCQDWGPIFLADNVTITRAPAPPAITQQPVPGASCAGGAVTFFVGASGTMPLTHQWRKNAVALSDGPSGTGSTISGAATSTLMISGITADDAGAYDCIVGNAYGSVTSDAAGLSLINPCDANCDGSINAFDIQHFVEALSPNPPVPCSPCGADANEDGSVNAFDIQAFVTCLGG